MRIAPISSRSPKNLERLMKKYASYSKIREDTQAPKFITGSLFQVSWGLRKVHDTAGSVLKMPRCSVEHLMRCSEGSMSCDDEGGVCVDADFFRKTPKKIQDFIIVSVNYINQEGGT